MDSQLLGFGGIAILVCLTLRENVHNIDFNHKISSQIGNFHGILDCYTILENLCSGVAYWNLIQNISEILNKPSKVETKANSPKLQNFFYKTQFSS